MNTGEFHSRLRELYLPPEKVFTQVDVPEIRYAVIDGAGDPAGAAGKAAVKWLYSVVHLVKPLVKQRMGRHFVDPPLECLCWADDPRDFNEGNRNTWKWRTMVAFIDWITEEQFHEAVARVALQRGAAPATLRLETLHEGRSVQITHVGDYAEVRAICRELYEEYLPANRLEPRGHYHEIYLNDPSRTMRAKRRLVIRQPVAGLSTKGTSPATR
jgi:hypothetical protein